MWNKSLRPEKAHYAYSKQGSIQTLQQRQIKSHKAETDADQAKFSLERFLRSYTG